MAEYGSQQQNLKRTARVLRESGSPSAVKQNVYQNWKLKTLQDMMAGMPLAYQGQAKSLAQSMFPNPAPTQVVPGGPRETNYDSSTGTVRIGKSLTPTIPLAAYAHEQSHALQRGPTAPWDDASFTETERAASNELAPTLAGNLAEYEARRRSGGRPLVAPTPLTQGYQPSMEWMRQQAQQHGLYGGKSMEQLLAENPQYVRLLAQQSGQQGPVYESGSLAPHAADAFDAGGSKVPTQATTPIAPVRRRSTAQGRAVQYDKFGRPFRSEITQGPGFDLSPPAAAPAAPFIPTAESPATPDQVARAFYGPSMPGAPPPEMTQAQYQARKAGVAPVAPVSIQRRMSPQEIDAQLRLNETIRNHNPAYRQDVVIDGEAFQPNGAPSPGAYGGRLPETQVGAGMQSNGMVAGGGFGTPLMRGRLPAGMENPAAAAVAREAARRPVEYARGRGAMVGGNMVAEDDFQQAWKERQAAVARGETPPGPAQLMAGIAERARPMLTRTMGEVTVPQMVQDLQRQPVPVAPVMRPYAMSDRYGGSNAGLLNTAARAPTYGGGVMAGIKGFIPDPSFVMGAGPKISAGALADEALGAGVRYANSAGAVRNPTAPVSRMPVQQPVISPTITPQGGSWFPGQQAPAQAGAVVQPTGSSAASTQQAAASAAGTTAAPVAPTGMSTRAKVGTAAGVGLGALGAYSMANGQPVAPLPPAPEGTQNQYYSRMYSGVNGGLTTDPRVAANRAAFESSMANRKNRAAGRGIAKGEARDMRMGQASPEVLSRANLAQGDISLDRDWQGNVRMTRSMAPLVGMYGAQQRSVSDAAEPMLLAQAARYNTDMAAAQAELAAATTPEAQAAAMQRMQAIQQQQFSVPQAPTPDQFRQSMFGNEFSGPVSGQPMIVNTPIAPVRQTGSNPTASSGREFSAGAPSVPEEIAPGGDQEAYAKRQKEIADAIANRESFERRKGQAKKGLIPWGSGDMAIVSSMDTDAAAKWFADKYGVSYKDAYQQVLDKQMQGSGLTMPSGY